LSKYGVDVERIAHKCKWKISEQPLFGVGTVDVVPVSPNALGDVVTDGCHTILCDDLPMIVSTPDKPLVVACQYTTNANVSGIGCRSAFVSYGDIQIGTTIHSRTMDPGYEPAGFQSELFEPHWIHLRLDSFSRVTTRRTNLATAADAAHLKR
jgi:hypothetical protein